MLSHFVIDSSRSAEIEDTKSRIDFLSLSAELRNRIYELALTPEEEDEGGVEGSTAIYVGEGMDREGWEQVKLFEGYHYESHYNFGWPTPWVGQPALTKVSRQIRQETLPVYYGLNYFAAAVDGDVEVDGNPMLEIINEDDVNPINHEWLNHSYYLPVNCLLSWMVCIGQENIDRLRQLQIFTDSEPAGVFLDGKSRGPQNIPGEKAEIRVRRWLERELARHDLTMPHVSLTTHTWCPELEGGKWLQTN